MDFKEKLRFLKSIKFRDQVRDKFVSKILENKIKPQGLTINELPPELILQILHRVDEDSLKNAILTCNLWKQLIESSHSWSIVLSHNNDFLLTTNRKFHSIEITDTTLGGDYIIAIFKRLGRYIVKLFVNRCDSDECHIFIELLKYMPNLEHIKLYLTGTKWSMSDIPPESDLPELKKLKILESVVCEQKIIKCFARSQLEIIKLLTFSGFGNPREDVEHQPIIDLLRSQRKLTTLAIRAIYHNQSQLFHTNVLQERMPFQLTKLSLLDFKLRETPNDYNNLLKFMKNHMKTLKKLELGRKFPKGVYEFVFANFANLKSLRLKINELPEDMVLNKNESINQLILIDFSQLDLRWMLTPFMELLRNVPNVTELTLLEYGDSETLRFIASTLTKLNKLNVNNVIGSMFLGVQFSNLTSLNIHKLDYIIDWDEFTKLNCGITELAIETVLNDCFNPSTIEKIAENLKLRALRIGTGFLADRHFYDIIRTNCVDLKTITLHTSCAIEDIGLGDIPGLRFYDKSLSGCCDGFQIWKDTLLSDELLTDQSEFDTEDEFNSDVEIDSEDDIDAEVDVNVEDDIDDDINEM